MFSFKNNVYWIKGHIRSCIYDFNTCKLYHCTKEETNFVQWIIGKTCSELHFTDLQKSYFDFLVQKNIIVASEQLNTGDMYDLHMPAAIDFSWIEVTNRCNLKCIHCYDESCIESSEIMDFTDFQYVIDELTTYGIHKIQIIGGEPLLLKNELKRMILYAKDKFDYIEVFTNGTLIDIGWVEFFRQYNIRIALSVYSYIPEMHDTVTQSKGSFSHTCANIRLLKEYDIKYRVANVIMKGISIGDKNTDLFTLNPQKDIVRMTGRAKLDLLTDDLIKRRLITESSFTKPLNVKLINRIMRGHNCFSRRLYISATLNVYPCVMERRLCHGNLKNHHLNDIVQDRILKFDKDCIKECSECEFKYCCHDCRPDSISNKINAKPWYCTYKPLEGEWYDIEEYVKSIKNTNY